MIAKSHFLAGNCRALDLFDPQNLGLGTCLQHYCVTLMEVLYLGNVNVEVLNNLYGAVLVAVSALQVLYDVRGFLEKNRDTFRDDILNMLKDSRYVPLVLVRRPHLLGETKPHSCNN